MTLFLFAYTFFFMIIKYSFSFTFVKMIVERLRLSDLIIPLCVGHSLQRARREVQTPPLCEFRLAVEFSLTINFIIAHLNSSVARFRISLSSVVRMTASVYLAEIYCTFVGSSTEAKRNRMLSLRGRTNSRHTAVSLIHLL